MEVFTWEKLTESHQIKDDYLEVGQSFKPRSLKLVEGATSAPKHLTESDLI